MDRRYPLRAMYTSVSRMSTRAKNQVDHYQVLEIKPESTQEEIKSAYYKLTMIYHPDKNKSKEAEEKFRKVSDAYEILSNYESRKQYDRGVFVSTPKKTQNQKTTPDRSSFKSYKVQKGTFENFQGGNTSNFDDRTKSHTSVVFERRKRFKEDFADVMTYKYSRNSKTDEKAQNSEIMANFVFCVFLGLFFVTVVMKGDDYQLSDKKWLESEKEEKVEIR